MLVTMQRHLDCSTSFPNVTAGSVHLNRSHIIHRMNELLTKQPHHFLWRRYFYYRTVLSRASLCTAFCAMWWMWVTQISCVSRVTDTGPSPSTVTAVQTDGPAWKLMCHLVIAKKNEVLFKMLTATLQSSHDTSPDN